MKKKKIQVKGVFGGIAKEIAGQIVARFNEIQMAPEYFKEVPDAAKRFGSGDLLIVQHCGDGMMQVSLRPRKKLP